jgi:DNA-binding winged helix-turn-helix (wHTH) protein/tetratricopeptide (TPR) repeat protein/TolB-like protein
LLFLRDDVVSITPRALAVLRLLVERAGDLVTKEDLVARVWAGAFIEESNITKNIAEVRRVLKAGFRNVNPIRTVWKQGYRFDVPVELVAVVEDHAPRAPHALLPNEADFEPAAVVRAAIVPAAIVPAAHAIRSFRLPALGAALLCVVAAGIYLISKFWTSLTASHNSVAVLGVRNLSNVRAEDWIGGALTETLTSELDAGGEVHPVRAEEVIHMRADLGFDPGSAYDSAALRKIRSNLGCKFAVTGTFLVSGDGLRLDLHVQDTNSGESRGSWSETGNTANLLELVSRAGTGLRKILGDRNAPVVAAASRSASAEALRLYAQGVEKLRLWDTAGAQTALGAAAKSADGYAPIHAALSMTWSVMGFDAKAREEARRAMETSAGLPRDQQLHIEARYAETTGNWPKAIETWAALVRFYPGEIDYSERLATALSASGKPAETVAKLQTLHSTDPRLLLAESAASLALGNYQAAIQAAAAAETGAKQRSARLLESRALLARGAGLLRLNEFDKAREAYREAGRISAAIGDRNGVLGALQAEGEVLRGRGESAAAQPVLEQALALSQEIGNRNATMQALMALSSVHRSRADMAGARGLLEQCLEIARETGNGNLEVQAQLNMGNIVNNAGDPEGGRKIYASVLQRAREIGDRYSASLAMGNIGIMDYVMGNLTAGISESQEALTMKRALGGRDSISYTLIFLGRMSLAAGDTVSARRYLEESAKLLKEIGVEPTGNRVWMAELAIAEGHPEAAEEPMKEAAAKFDKPNPGSDAWRVLAKSWLARGDIAKARDAAAHAVALAAKTPNRSDYGIPAAIIAARVEIADGGYPKARTALNALLMEARKLHHVPNQLGVRLAGVELEVRSGNVPAANAALRELDRDAARQGFSSVGAEARRLGKAPLRAKM